MNAVFNLSRMWYFTGNTNYAQHAHDILLAWANTMTNFGGVEADLDIGGEAVAYGGGADILRGTWPGWTAADTLTVSNFFEKVYLPGAIGSTNFYTQGPANKGALSMVAGVAIATFCDDTNLFNQMLYRFARDAGEGLRSLTETKRRSRMGSVRVLVGTRKGAFILSADGKRKNWKVSGPLFAGWEIYHLKGSAVDPNRLYA